ncbi:hypothetical protein [Terrihabitans sp. B22-R8]|uniref:hypothetical protein n=1 Tax=Terrihabitans sp. B22-R8 TaxID=3425128 RepID=UPI00403CA165
MKLSTIKTDDTRRQTGDWVRNIPEMGDLELKVRGVGNDDYRRLQDKLIREVPLHERRTGLLPATQDRVTVELQVETLLEDWRNFTDDNDKPIPFTKKKARELLEDPDFIMFRDAVAYAATVVAEIRDEAKKADVQD